MLSSMTRTMIYSANWHSTILDQEAPEMLEQARTSAFSIKAKVPSKMAKTDPVLTP